MKVLVAYDGSESAEAAVVDLRRAGLPKDSEILVVSVAAADVTPTAGSDLPASAISQASKTDLYVGKALTETVHKWIESNFPEWKSTSQVLVGSPVTAILEKTVSWRPDLIVVGSHGRSLAGSILLGSVSKKLTHESPCSVRVVRAASSASKSASHGTIRILVGSDGSAGAKEVIRKVAERVWPEKTEVHIVSVLEEPDDQLRSRLTQAAEEFLSSLQRVGLKATSAIVEGDPKRVLVAAAARWKATAIFLGARGLGRLEEILLGSVSNSVLNHAQCVVEIVRGK
jgi:Universal stress protein UspA and related nucleotide-binding proteins